jgi:thiamine-phosphate pyrophosphorylase
MLITDRFLCPQQDLVPSLELALTAGVKGVQLREKDLTARQLLALASGLTSVCARFGAKLLINERADIAAITGADGTHCTARSLPATIIKNSIIPGKLVGVSTHSMKEARNAQAGGADYIVFGPVYETASKLRFGNPRGLDSLREVCAEIGIPVLAIGGITPARADECLQNGAYGVAVISAILAQEQIGRAVENFGTIIGEL